MDRDTIKAMLHEALKIKEENGQPTKKPMKGKSKDFRGEYNEIQSALDDTLLTKSGAMEAAGLGNADDAGDRRAFNAKLDREENENGSVRQFSDNELSSLAAVVGNPKAYLNSDGKNKTKIKKVIGKK